MWSGAWKSFEELEECLTVDQLLLLIKHGRKRDDRLYKVIMASAGAEVDWSEEEDELKDIADLSGAEAAREGFGIGFGLEYSVEE